MLKNLMLTRVFNRELFPIPLLAMPSKEHRMDGDLSTFSAQIIKIIKYQIHCDRFMEISRETFFMLMLAFQAYKKIIDLENHYWFRQCHKFSKYWKKETSNKLECIVCIFQYCFGLAFSGKADLSGVSRFVNDRLPVQASCAWKTGPGRWIFTNVLLHVHLVSENNVCQLRVNFDDFSVFPFFSSLPYVYNILLFT